MPQHEKHNTSPKHNISKKKKRIWQYEITQTHTYLHVSVELFHVFIMYPSRSQKLNLQKSHLNTDLEDPINVEVMQQYQILHSLLYKLLDSSHVNRWNLYQHLSIVTKKIIRYKWRVNWKAPVPTRWATAAKAAIPLVKQSARSALSSFAKMLSIQQE